MGAIVSKEEYTPESKNKDAKTLSKCNIEKYVESGNIDELNDCYYLHYFFPNFKPQKINNPLDDDERCYLINNKRDEYYRYKYEPQKVIDHIRDYDIDESIKNEYIANLEEISDLEPKENCCNCITFILYSVYFQEIYDEFNKENQTFEKTDEFELEEIVTVLSNMYTYLYSLSISIRNIDRNLPEFISRIYLDISVFKVLYETHNIIKKFKFNKNTIQEYYNKNIEIIELFFNTKSVEVYTVSCKSYSENIHSIRTLRSSVLIDPTVNIKIFREADGYVSNLDCINIRRFMNANTLMLLYHLEDYNLYVNTSFEPTKNSNLFMAYDNLKILNSLKTDFRPTTINNERYSNWLKNEYTRSEYVKSGYSPIIDLYAGLLGYSLQVKSKNFYSIIKPLYHYTPKSITLSKNKFNVTIDERFLFRLFVKLISVNTLIDEIVDGPYIEIDTPERLNKIFFLLHNFSYPKKIIKFEIDEMTEINKIIDNLELNSIIKKEYKNQIKKYYSYLFESIGEINFLNDNDKTKRNIILFLDIIFQNEIIINNNEILDIQCFFYSYPPNIVPKILLNSYFSHYLLNYRIIESQNIADFIYINQPFEPMTKEIQDIYQGGYYNKQQKYYNKLHYLKN
jgi:hypothetical protein